MEIQILTSYYYYKTMLKGGTGKLCVSPQEVYSLARFMHAARDVFDIS